MLHVVVSPAEIRDLQAKTDTVKSEDSDQQDPDKTVAQKHKEKLELICGFAETSSLSFLLRSNEDKPVVCFYYIYILLYDCMNLL